MKLAALLDGAANIALDPSGLTVVTGVNVQLAIGQLDSYLKLLTISQLVDVEKGSVAPSAPVVGDVWIDTSSTAEYVGCRAHKSTSQAIATGTHVAITFDVEDHDDGGFHSTATNTDRFTVPASGRYRIEAQIEFQGQATPAGDRAVIIWLGAVSTGERLGQEYRSGSTLTASNPPRIPVTTGVVTLTAGDIIRLGGWQNSGVSLNAQASVPRGSTWLSIQRMD